MGRKIKGGKKPPAGASSSREFQEEEYKKAPHSFIFHRGQVGKYTQQLVKDMRHVMEPYTASNLKVRKNNVLKDFVSVAGSLNISHFMVFTKTDAAMYLKLMRLPRGPTLTFKVEAFSLSSDVVSTIKRHHMDSKQFKTHPLLVMNNFSGEGLHLKLMASMFQNLFPAINVNKVKLGAIRRCVLLNLNKEDGNIEFRHYNIKAVPVGMSRPVKKLIQARIPNLSKLQDVSDFLLKDGNLSESEAEVDGPHNEITLPQSLASRGNIKASKSAIRLTEIGPRLTLKLVKIEEGINEGEVLYHSLITKTEEEKQATQKAKAKKKKLKLKRKEEQEKNLARKQREKEENKMRAIEGMKRKQLEEADSDAEDPGEDNVGYDDDDDTVYYEQEVGEAADPDLFLSKGGKSMKRKATDRSVKHPRFANKKPRTDGDKMTKSGKGKHPRFANKKPRTDGDKMTKSGKGKHPRFANKKPRTDGDKMTKSGKGDKVHSKKKIMTPMEKFQKQQKKRKDRKEAAAKKRLKKHK